MMPATADRPKPMVRVNGTYIISTLIDALLAAGVEDIGQWPRILLAASGLCAGFLFDIKSRKYMGVAMYCVMILSTLCIAVQRLSGPFLLGLVVFYMSAGFFAVFFTAGFMELSRYMRVPGLWAGMGRAVNNLTAALIANPVLMLISGKDDFAVIALLLALFVFISITAFFYTSRRYLFLNQPKSENAGAETTEEKLRRFAEAYSFTDREAEAFRYLVMTEDTIQGIAGQMYISKRTLERHRRRMKMWNPFRLPTGIRMKR